MFCGCANRPHDSEPNTHICPVCMAHPGSLPVPNEAAIKSVLLFGTAVGGSLATYSEFDRKNYFYPDIPKAYQLSQYAFPFVKGGTLAGVELTRVHLEEDTARSQHDKGAGSLVDYNRAGVPLMELVTEPVIHDAETAGKFARELQLLLRTIGISDANMEKGEMRVEANISVSKSTQLGVKVEVKNLNSFRSVESAIRYEIDRQIAILEAGGEIQQETRGWDENKNETFLQRSKETAKDYRYFPDPDIPKYQIDAVPDFSTTALAEIMPELPQEKRKKYSVLGLTDLQIETVIQDEIIRDYFDDCITVLGDETGLPTAVANYLLTDLVPQWNVEASMSRLTATHFVALMRLVATRKVTSRVAKDLIIEFANKDTDLVAEATERGLLSTMTIETLETMVREIIAAHESVAAEYKAGKVASLQFLLGQAMKATKGAADPNELRRLFEAVLQE
ncbi:MAG: Asp-tRNA(Asn)/Glu-tRNA(Gln) amidotransferase subunit GatB [Candidatus Pacebacteria bacterium]|nr:Asp-tRNA(Asn)/Glu-tRNA(Gln) amidotransferase subunit GatB [Candidatus Paceibacterota bacterium]